MNNAQLLRLQAESAYQELLESLAGVTEQQAWARIECQPDEYLHTEGSILSIVAHVAACKFIYGSVAFKGLEVRWRDTVARLEAIWPDWEAMKGYLDEAQAYWLASWAEEQDFERMVQRFDGKEWPSWKIVWTVTDHDGYHAGQIQVLRSVLAPSQAPPPEEGELWRKYCGDLQSW